MKVGDRVRVVAGINYKGAKGVITEHDDDTGFFEWWVQPDPPFDDGHGPVPFRTVELMVIG